VDLIGKRAVSRYKLLGGRCHQSLPAYANGCTAALRRRRSLPERACAAWLALPRFEVRSIRRRWKDLSDEESEAAVSGGSGSASGRAAMGLMIEFHGRLSVGSACA